MASMLYQPALEILKAANGKPMGACDVKNRILSDYPEVKWGGTQGPVRAMLLTASEKNTPIKRVPDSKPPMFYFDDTASLSASADLPEPSSEEVMDAAFEKVQSELKDELLLRIQKMDETEFEVLVNKLIAKLGFGRPVTTQKTHDLGIDGYIYSDPLGLNVIGVQAKRYDGHNVQRPEIDKFIGALEGRNGVFVTSAGFSPEARIKAEKTGSQSKIALIDGPQMVDFMITYNLGVQETGKVYSLKRIDQDFFSNPEDV